MDSFGFITGAGILTYILVFWLVRLLEIHENKKWVPTLQPNASVSLPEELPLISVLVPAHNEEKVIELCLKSILEQDYENLELICVDDRSTDQTGSIVRKLFHNRANCRLVTIDKRQAGWTGKCHALDVASGFAKGEWLAFLDADSSLHPKAFKQCLSEALRRKVNLITLTPRFVLRTFWEKALQPTLASMAAILFPLSRVNDPSSPVATANGMFFMVSRKAYDKIGGHKNVRDLAVEDIGIGKRIKAAGLGLLFANGRNLLCTRMYSSCGEVLKGWTRILSAAMNYKPSVVIKFLPMHILVSFPCFIMSLCMYVEPAQELMPHSWFLLPLACVFAMILGSFRFFYELGLPRRYSIYIVVGNLTLILVHLIILKKILFKDALQWRGETYCTTRYQPKSLEPSTKELWGTQAAKQLTDELDVAMK